MSMYCWRITKYDPSHRDSASAYQPDDWTAASDIGTMFSGTVLEAADYLEMEDAYVQTVRDFMDEAELTELAIEDIELSGEDQTHLAQLGLHPVALMSRKWPELPVPLTVGELRQGQALVADEVSNVTRLTLRSILWCKLTGPGGFYVHFGHDYYLYVGTPSPSRRAIESTRARGLFVERKRSPYLD